MIYDTDYGTDFATSEQRGTAQNAINDAIEELVERFNAFAEEQRGAHPGAQDENGFGYLYVDVHELVAMSYEADISRHDHLYLYAYANSGDYIRYQTEPDFFDDAFDADAWSRGLLTNSRLETFPELDAYLLFGTSAGKTVFYDEQNDRFLFADGSGNILYTSPENMTYMSSWWDEAPSEFELHGYAKEGMFPFVDRDTGEQKYLNMEDFSIVELDPEYSVMGYTYNGEYIAGAPIGTTFREGMKAVAYAETADARYAMSGMLYAMYGMPYGVPMGELDAAGYIDKTGEFAFKFCDLPQFEGQIVTRVGEYYNGTAIVQCRPRTGPSGLCSSIDELYLGTYYEIDKEGNILRECSEEEYQSHNDPREDELRPDDSFRLPGIRNRMEENVPIPAERILLKDDLVLYKNVETGGFEMMDANGTVYPLDALGQIVSAHVMGNGLVALAVLETSKTGDEWAELRYYVQYEDIRPADFVPDTQGFEPQAVRVSDYCALPE